MKPGVTECGADNDRSQVAWPEVCEHPQPPGPARLLPPGDPQVDPPDRRRLRIRPAAAGRAAWDSYVHKAMSCEQHLCRHWSPPAGTTERIAAQV